MIRRTVMVGALIIVFSWIVYTFGMAGVFLCLALFIAVKSNLRDMW